MANRVVARWCESKILSTYAHGTREEGNRESKGAHQRGQSRGLRAEGAAYAIESSP